MSAQISTAAVHHVALTVSDMRRSQKFYTEVLNFQHVTDFGPRALLHNGSFLLEAHAAARCRTVHRK